MKKIVLILLSCIVVSGDSPFETPKPKSFDLSCFDTLNSAVAQIASESQQVRCRYVCDKRLYKEQKIAEAISFYKSSKDYNKSW